MGANSLQFGRSARFSAVHKPCREQCKTLVQAFHVRRAGIEQRRTPRCKRKLHGIPKFFHPLSLRPTVRLNIPVQVEAEVVQAERQAHRRAAKARSKSFVETGSRHQTLRNNGVCSVHKLSRIQHRPVIISFRINQFTNGFTKIFTRKKASCDASKIDFKHDHCKRKMLGKADAAGRQGGKC